MAYADQQGMSANRIIAIVLVAGLHAFIAFALISGLAYEAVKKVKEKMEVVDVKEEEKPPEEEPPPPDEKPLEPPPITAPPPPFQPPTKNPLQPPPPPDKPEPFTPEPAKPANPGGTGVTCPDGSRAPSLDACPKPPPPPKQSQKKSAVPKGNPGSWANTNDYPSRALTQEREGTTGFRVTIGPDGRVTDCQITSSSGHADLDQATCANVKRRARFAPALDDDGNPTSGSYSNRISWRIPKE
jgi:periplasmic protein TonB